MATNCPKPIEVTVGFVAGANWDLVHLRTSVRAGPQTRLWSLSSVTGNPLKLGICASRPLGLLSTRVSSSGPKSADAPEPSVRCVLTQSGRLGDGKSFAHGACTRSAAKCHLPTSAARRDPSLRSRLPVYELRIWQAVSGSGRDAIHGFSGRLLRQRDGRIVLGDAGTRSVESPALQNAGRSEDGDLLVDRRLV